MNLEKLKVKALMAENFGREFEKDIERSRTKVLKLQGANEALVAAIKSVTELIGVTKDKVLAFEIKLEANDEIGLAKFIVAQMQPVVRKLHDMAELANANSIRADGERAAFEDVVKRLKGVFDEELNKLQNLEKQIKDGSVKVVDGDLVFVGDGPRPPGVHPGPTLKMQRQDETSEPSKAAESTEVVEEKKDGGSAKKTRQKKAKPEALDDRNS